MSAPATLVMALLLAAGGARAALDGDMAELARALRASCAADTGVDQALLAAVDAGATLPPDERLKCYIKCTMETAGMFGDGAVDVEAVVALLPDDFRARNEHNLRACGSRRGSDDCDTAFRTQQCWQAANKDDYFLI